METQEKYVDPLVVMMTTVGGPVLAVLFFVLLFTFPIAVLLGCGLLWLIAKVK